MKNEKTPGQIAYESDCAREPNYQDGTRRRSWNQLPKHARESWERNPTPRARAKRIALVYQTGIANVFQVDTFSNAPEGRNARRLLQDAFTACEWFTRGMLNAGNCEIRIYSCNRAGDIATAPWVDGLADCPFRDNARPPKTAA